MKLEIFLIKKFVKFKGEGYLSFLSIFTVFGIFVGVSALVIVIGVMTGFHEQVKRRIIGVSPHIIVSKYFDKPFDKYEEVIKEIDEINGIKEISPFAYAKIMIKNNEYADGGIIRGIEKGSEVIKNYLEGRMVYGEFNIEGKNVIMGIDIAQRLRVYEGDTIMIYSPFLSKITPFGIMMKTNKYCVSGIFDAGYFDFNTSLLITNINNVRELLDYEGDYVQGLEIFLKEPYKADLISKKIEKKLGYPFKAITWIEMNKSLFSALKLEKLAMFLILILIIFVASFNIITTLLMLLVKKTREIAILRSMGFRGDRIFKLFILEGMYLGMIGVFLGVIFGSFTSIIFDKFKILKLPPDVYFIDYMPLKVEVLDVVLIVFASLFVIFLSTLYPAKKAQKIILRDALRYE